MKDKYIYSSISDAAVIYYYYIRDYNVKRHLSNGHLKLLFTANEEQ